MFFFDLSFLFLPDDPDEQDWSKLVGVDKLELVPVELADDDAEDEVIEDELELELEFELELEHALGFNAVDGRLGILPLVFAMAVIGGVTSCCLPLFMLGPCGVVPVGIPGGGAG